MQILLKVQKSHLHDPVKILHSMIYDMWGLWLQRKNAEEVDMKPRITWSMFQLQRKRNDQLRRAAYVPKTKNENKRSCLYPNHVTVYDNVLCFKCAKVETIVL